MNQKTRTLLQVGTELFFASFIVLFQELSLIRWLPGQVRVLAYFPNLILLSAFLGLGIGCLRAEQKSLLWLWPASLLILIPNGSRKSSRRTSPGFIGSRSFLELIFYLSDSLLSQLGMRYHHAI